MNRELAVVIGMSLSYAASLAGMFIAMWAYKRNVRRRRMGDTKPRPPAGGEVIR